MGKLPSTNRFEKIRNLIFIVLIGLLLVTPLVYWLSLDGHWQSYSDWEDRNLTVFPALNDQDFRTAVKRIAQGLPDEAGELFFNQFISGLFQRRVSLATGHQMLLRYPLIDLSTMYKRIMVQGVYAILPDPAILTSPNSNYYFIRDDEYFVRTVKTFGEQEKADIDLRIANYEQLLSDFPDIHFYAYNIETLEYSPFHVMAQYYPNADNGQSLVYFLEKKPQALAFRNYALTSFQDYKDRFFRTDHHWNIRASVDAYQDIYAMLKEQYETISPPVEVKEYRQIKDLEFLGGFAKTTLYPVKPESLEYAVVDMEDFETYIDGEMADLGDRESYLDGSYDHGKYINHYRGFFGKQEVEVYYHFDHDTGRNLLMITSSYARTIQAMLASHFDDTYVIDLRFEENQAKTLHQMIADDDITDVLILGQADVTYLSAENAINP